jgi:hypothetical protein
MMPRFSERERESQRLSQKQRQRERERRVINRYNYWIHECMYVCKHTYISIDLNLHICTYIYAYILVLYICRHSLLGGLYNRTVRI